MNKDQYITVEYFDNKLDQRFETFEKKIDEKFDDLAVILSKSFKSIDERFDLVDKQSDSVEYEIDIMGRDVSTKKDIHELHAHIGKIEVRFQNIEEIVLHDHYPRIRALEKFSGI